MSARPDALVIGAGVIGTACALELATAGLRVTVLDRGRPGGEASGASAGLLSGFSPSRAGALAELARMSRDLHGPLAERLREEAGLDVEHESGGHLHLCLTEADSLDARRLAADPARGMERLTWISPEELRRIEPAVTPEAHGAVLLPGNGWVNNERLVTALVRAAARRGVEFRTEEAVDGVLRERDRVTGVQAHRTGTILADWVVLAAGVWSGRIAGVPPALRTRPVKGQMLALRHVPPVLRRVVLARDLYLVPRASGECLVGATVEDGAEDRAVDAAGLRWLLDRALGAAPGLARLPVARVWAGLRPATADDLPVIGLWPGLSGLVVATGHLRSGILLAPATALAVRDLVVDGRTDLPIGAVLPDRLAT